MRNRVEELYEISGEFFLFYVRFEFYRYVSTGTNQPYAANIDLRSFLGFLSSDKQISAATSDVENELESASRINRSKID